MRVLQQQKFCKKLSWVYRGEEQMTSDHKLTKHSKLLPSLQGASCAFQWPSFSAHTAWQENPKAIFQQQQLILLSSEPLILISRKRSMPKCLELVLINPLWDEVDMDNSSISGILVYICGWRHKLWRQIAWVSISALPPTSYVTLGS